MDSYNRKVKVLLVASPKTDLGFGRSVSLPNIGLYSIAANLDHTICDVNVLDLVVAGRNPRKYLQNVLVKHRPDVVGFSCMTFQYNDTLELTRITKLVDNTIKVVLGGYHATVASDMILNNDNDMQYIDFLIRTEGEVALNEFIRALYNGNDFKKVPNLSYRKNGSILNNPTHTLLDLDEIKLPDRSVGLIKNGFYMFGNPVAAIETSRGCTSNCDFCSIQIMYGKNYRKYKIERVINDIKDGRKHGARAIFIGDDNITLHGKRYKELCEAIIDTELNNMHYFIQASIKGLYHTPGLIDSMKKSGVKWIFIGIENISDDNLKFLDKNDQFKRSDVMEVVTELRRNNILVIGGFIIGNPDDTEESIKANYEYAKKLRLDIAIFFILTPFPKTEIRDKLIKQGLITNLDDFTEYTCFKANVKTKHLSSKQLYKLREEMGYRYPINSGSVWRLAKEFTANPIYYTVRLGLGQLVKNPIDVLQYLKGFSGKF